jgi:zinc protease
MGLRRGTLLALAAAVFTAFAATPLTLSAQAAAAAPAPAKAPPRAPSTSSPAPVKVATVEGITEYRLANGLSVLLFPDPTKPTVTVNITYRVGSRHENYGETGMAHLLEHLLFKGSKNHRDINQELTSHGARSNASTWFDRTNYFETLQATDANLKWALEMEADRMVNSFVAKKDLDTEMTVVRNEFEMGENDPASILQERVLSTAFLWHNYGKSTIGAKADLEHVPIDRLQAFYRTYYQPDNAVLLIAGRFDEAKTIALVNRIFGPIPKPKRTLPALYTLDPVQDGERQVTLERVGDVQAIAAAYHAPAGSSGESGAIELLTEILTDTPSGRLYKALVETKKAASVGGYFMALHDPGFLMFDAEVRQDQSVADARSAMLAALDAAAGSQPITEQELQRARTSILKNVELLLNSPDRVGLQLSEYIGQGDWRLFFLTRDRVRQATLEDVRKVAAAYLKPSNRTVGVFLPTAKPDRAEVAAPPDVASLLRDYKGDAAVAAGEAFDPSPANLEARTRRSALPNGMKMALLRKKTRGSTVVGSLTLRFGDPTSLAGKDVAADMSADMLMRGTTKHTRQEIQDELDRLKARIGVGGRAGQATLSFETVRENLPAVLRLAAEILREPAFPEKEFEELRQENLAAIEEERSEPQSVGGNAYERHMNPYPKGDVRYVETLEETLESYKAATLDKTKAFYGDFFGGSNGQLAVVGDFDEAEVAGLAAELFGNWKSPAAFARIPQPYQDVPPANESLQTPDKANAYFIAGQNLKLRDEDPDYPALLFGNYMLGSSDTNRLFLRIRDKEGLSYGVGSQLAASPLDDSGAFTTFAIYAPQNAARLESAFREEIAKVLADGFTASEVADAKSGWLQSRQITRSQDASVARMLTAELYLGRTFAWDAELDRKVQALTPEQVLAAMRRHIDPAKMTLVKAGDFDKAAK